MVVGLGNPGERYSGTRHNVGFMLIDRLAVKLNASFSRMQSKALVASETYNKRRIILAKPQTFMNLSGHSVQGLVHFYKIPMINLLIAHDDLDLPVGAIRIRPDGGSAGQMGMESIIQRLSTDEFARIRLGIGRPPGQMQAADYVLQDFPNDEKVLISGTLNSSVEAVLTFVMEGLEAAMNKYNVSAVQP